MKKKIHFFLGQGIYPKIVGGMEIFNYYLIKNLLNDFTISYSATTPFNFTGAQFIKLRNLRPTKFTIPIQFFFILLFSPGLKTIVLSYSNAHWIIWYSFYLICKLLKREYIIIIHYGKDPTTQKYRYYQRFFKSAKSIISVSDDIKIKYEKFYHISCETIWPLVPFIECNKSKEELRREFQIPQNANVLCMIGSIKKMKNPSALLECIHSFTEKELALYNPYIIYAGTGNEVDSLKNKSKEYSLEDRVKFLGFVPKEEVNKIYKLSDIYLILSDFEGTSISLLEAMFNEKAIITSRAPGITSTIIENSECLMFKTNDTNELKYKIIELLSNESQKRNLGSAAKKHFHDTYDYKFVLNRYKHIFS